MADPARLAPAARVEVRAARAGERATARALAGAAFSPRDPAPAPLPTGAEDHLETEEATVLHWVAVEDSAVVASATARQAGQWFGGARLPVAALSSVAVQVTHRGRGVGRDLVTGLFGAARDAGAALCALYPSTHRFYASLGCGTGGRRPVFALSTTELRAALPRPGAGYAVRFAEPRDAAAVAALAADRAARGEGLIDHDGPPGTSPQDPSGPGAFVVESRGRVTGWCLLHRKPATRAGAAYDLLVADLLAADTGSELALWHGLVADTPQALRADAVVTPGGLLERLLERQVAAVENATWMLRLLDVDAALAGRGYPAATTAEVTIAVTDAQLAANAGTRTLRVSAGRGHVEPAPHRAADVTVDTAVLASVFTGHLDPVAAAHEGLLGCTPATARVLRALFTGPPAVLARAF